MKPGFSLSRVLHPVTATIFPSFCRLCGGALDEPGEKIVCTRCFDRIEVHRGPVCPVCGRFYQQATATGQLCGSCLERAPEFSRHRSLGPYSGRLKEVILLFKYKSCEILSRPLSEIAYRQFAGDGLFEDLDFIVPVPLHRKREKQRGFNQAELLGRALSRWSGVPVLSGVLIKIRNTPAQVSLEAAEREINLRRAFMVKNASKISGRVVLLVDDVFTTGSTLTECAAELRRAGAEEVRGLTLARAV